MLTNALISANVGRVCVRDDGFGFRVTCKGRLAKLLGGMGMSV